MRALINTNLVRVLPPTLDTTLRADEPQEEGIADPV